MLLYGKNSVAERLKTNPQTIKRILLQDNFNNPYIEKLIKKNNIPLLRLPVAKLSKIKYGDNLQGIVAEVCAFNYTFFEDLLDKDKRLTPIFLDRIYDPQNLGAIIRTAACFGGFTIIIPKHKACGVTETVLHIAQGGENYISVSMVSNLSNSIIAAKKSGYWIMGAVTSADAQKLSEVSMPFPLALVLGSEGEGVRYGVDKHLDIKAQIPMKGVRLSFNVTAACTIFCYEIDKQIK